MCNGKEEPVHFNLGADLRDESDAALLPLCLSHEVLDVDADTGGYNLQAAFSTGWVAGRSAGGGG